MNSIAGGHLVVDVLRQCHHRRLLAVYQERAGANKKRWSGLYEINPFTAAVKELYRLDGNASVAGALYPRRSIFALRPEALPAFAAEFHRNPLAGTLSFTAPAKAITRGLALGLAYGDDKSVNGRLHCGRALFPLRGLRARPLRLPKATTASGHYYGRQR